MPRERKMCSVDGCSTWAVSRGLCNRHYLQHLRNPGTTRYSTENGVSREKRLESLLALCDGFLHTLAALSDRACRRLGQTRSTEAQGLYELAGELRAKIRAEVSSFAPETSAPEDWLPNTFVSKNGHKAGSKESAT